MALAGVKLRLPVRVVAGVSGTDKHVVLAVEPALA
jgi:hypothetical protein